MKKDKEITADVIVIGSGAGGGFIATALAEAGKSVLLLERGQWFDYKKDFPARYPDWQNRGSAFRLGSSFIDPTIDPHRGPPIHQDDLDLCSRRSINKLQNYKYRGGFNYRRVFGVGGSTLHYQGEAHRFPEHAFEMKDRYGFGINWPLSYRELEPYYAKAEKWLGVAGDPANPFKAERGLYPTPAHDLSTKTQWVKRASDKLGWSLLPNSLALPSQTYDGRSPCRYTGMCVKGCPFGAKSSVDLAVLPRGLKTGKLKILDKTRVLDLETNLAGNINGVLYMQDGEKKRATADRYVLSTGAIESPRLLLASQSGRYPSGIGNQHDRVGRNLMETMFSVLTVEADRPVQAWKGQPIDSRIWDFNTPGQEGKRNGFVLGVSSSMSAYTGPLSYARRIAGSGKAHKDAMREKFGRVVNLFGTAEHSPDENNRMILSDRKDRQGMPKVMVSSDYNQHDKTTLREMINKLIILAEATGPAKIINLFSTYDNPQTTHMAGTCMMGDDPEQSVVDANGKVHGVKNLYIADASILPGQGMGDSPSLTIQALALRIAEKMV
ncbi:MAG: GMC family oxidoreductase [Arenicellales bacterium]